MIPLKSVTLAIGLQCRYALILASLNSLADNLPPNLIAALVEKGYWQPEQGLAYVQQVQKDNERAEGIKAIVPHLPEALLSQALDLARQIQYKPSRALALCSLVSNSSELATEALDIIRLIQNENERARALASLVPYLPEFLLPKALNIARQIQSDYSRAHGLSSLVPYYPELAADALGAIQLIKNESSRASALNSLVSRLPKSLIPDFSQLT